MCALNMIICYFQGSAMPSISGIVYYIPLVFHLEVLEVNFKLYEGLVVTLSEEIKEVPDTNDNVDGEDLDL